MKVIETTESKNRAAIRAAIAFFFSGLSCLSASSWNAVSLSLVDDKMKIGIGIYAAWLASVICLFISLMLGKSVEQR